MGVFMRGSDAFSWPMERDPISRWALVAVAPVDRTSTPAIEATSSGTGPIAAPGAVRVGLVRVVMQSAETP